MPKKKQPRKPTRRAAPSGRHTREVPPGWAPGAFGMTQLGMSRGLSSVPDEAWERLRAGFLEQHPACPDCDAAWDLWTSAWAEPEICRFGLLLCVPSGLVVLAWVDDEVTQDLAGGGVHDGDVEVLDEKDDVGSGVGSSDADVAELAGDAEGDAAGFVDLVVADAVVGVCAAVAAGGGLR